MVTIIMHDASDKANGLTEGDSYTAANADRAFDPTMRR
jgi:hypothetical protein